MEVFTLDDLRVIINWAMAKCDAVARTRNGAGKEQFDTANRIFKIAHDEYYRRLHTAGE